MTACWRRRSSTAPVGGLLFGPRQDRPNVAALDLGLRGTSAPASFANVGYQSSMLTISGTRPVASFPFQYDQRRHARRRLRRVRPSSRARACCRRAWDGRICRRIVFSRILFEAAIVAGEEDQRVVESASSSPSAFTTRPIASSMCVMLRGVQAARRVLDRVLVGVEPLVLLGQRIVRRRMSDPEKERLLARSSR